MAIIQLTSTGASGEGTNQLSPTNFGVNASRSSQRSTTFTAGEYGLNKLTITQEQSPALFISFNDSNINQIVSPSSATSWTVSGSTNGRYMKYSISSGVTVSSAKEYSNNTLQGSSIGTSYSSVSSFVGGSQEFEYRVTISIPSGLSAGNYTLTVYSSDTQNGSGAVNQTFTLRVTAQAVNVQSVSIKSLGNTVTTLDIGKGTSYRYNNQTITVNNSSRNKLTYEVYPSNATIVGSATWTSSVPSVATVSSYGLVTGKSEGTTTITCEVTDANGNTASATCTVNVYEEGQITLGGNITIPYNSTTAQTTVGYTNVNSSSSTQVHFATRPWLNSVVLSSGNTALVAERITTSQTTLPESTSVYVTGVDILGNTVTSNTITVSQEMRIVISGAAQIGYNRNHEDYTMSYLPFDITGSQRNVTWSFNSSAANTYASITEQTVSSCTVAAKSGADNNQVTLVATNDSDNSINGQYVIWVSYRATGYGTITAVPSSVDLTYDATSDNSVTVTVQNAEIDEIRKGDNFLTNVSLNSNTGVLTVTFPANNEPTARTDSVHITSVDGIAEPAHIVYTQAAKPSPSIEITKLHANKDSQGYTTSAQFEVKFKNNTSNQMTYTIVSYELLGKSSGGTRTIWKQESIQNLNIEVWSEPVTRVFTISDITSTGVSSTYTLDVTATLSGATGSASDAYSGDGSDVISN